MIVECVFLSFQVVRERLVCHGIIGRQGSQEIIMTVDLTCRFVAPVLSIPTKKLNFFMKKVGPFYLTLVASVLASMTDWIYLIQVLDSV